MSCPTCNNGTGPTIVGGLTQLLAVVNAPCNSALCPSPQDSKCTFYSGAALPCSGINPSDSIETSLQKLDTALCAGSGGGNYATFNTYCLAPVTTAQSWVEKISSYVCNTNQTLSTFVGTTFPAYQSSIAAQLAAIAIPGTSSNCSSIVPINPGDSIQAILQKLSTGICTIYNTNLVSAINSANWNSCNTVSPTPSDLTSAFNTIISQICVLQNAQGAQLPVFDNTGSCLPSPTTADTLVDTVGKIKTVLCAAPIYNNNSVNWNCVSKPNAIGQTDLTTAMNAVMAKLDNLSQNFPTFNGSQFGVSSTNPSNPCQGVTVSLNSSLSDRLVAASVNDNAPGVLSAKIVGDGSTISVDYTSVNQGIIRYIGSGGSAGNGKILADSSDTIQDYLVSKIENSGVTSGVGIVFNLDTTNASHKVQPAVTVDPVALFSALLSAVSADSTGNLKTLFCSVVASCPTSCAAPSNVSIVYNGSTSTTTSTTTVPPSSTTTTTTTSGSSTTTSTTTTGISANIFFGAQSSSTPPNAATISTSSSTSQDPSANVAVDWRTLTASGPLYCWCAIPAAYPKTMWYGDSINNGPIGPGQTFGTAIPVTISGVSYSLYFGGFATQFTEIIEMEA